MHSFPQPTLFRFSKVRQLFGTTKNLITYEPHKKSRDDVHIVSTQKPILSLFY